MNSPSPEGRYTSVAFKRADGLEVSAVICRADIMEGSLLPVILKTDPQPTKQFFLENELLLYFVPKEVTREAVDFLVQFVSTVSDVGNRLGAKPASYTNGLLIETDPNSEEKLSLSSCGTDPGLRDVGQYNELWKLVPEGLYIVHTMRPEIMDTGWVLPPSLEDKRPN